jgi:hypothetical protein
MGLTVHYDLHRRCTVAEARGCIERIRAHALELGFRSVSPAFDLRGAEVFFERPMLREPDGLFRLHACVQRRRSRDRNATEPAACVLGFQCWPGQTEPSCIGLASWNEALEGEGEPTRTTHWRWSSFCKTQYACLPERGGVSHFLEAHTRLIRLLDYAASIGCSVRVEDEGRYWTTRDQEVLLRSLQEHNEIVAAVVGAVGDALPHVRRASPIRSHPSFERLEARGRRRLEDDNR